MKNKTPKRKSLSLRESIDESTLHWQACTEETTPGLERRRRREIKTTAELELLVLTGDVDSMR